MKHHQIEINKINNEIISTNNINEIIDNFIIICNYNSNLHILSHQHLNDYDTKYIYNAEPKHCNHQTMITHHEYRGFYLDLNMDRTHMKKRFDTLIEHFKINRKKLKAIRWRGLFNSLQLVHRNNLSRLIRKL